jgi:hypothetical protein
MHRLPTSYCSFRGYLNKIGVGRTWGKPGSHDSYNRRVPTMAEPKVWTFFYGSYINLDVLREVDYVPDQWEVARLAGFDIFIRPHANPVRSDQRSVYGILAAGTHAELGRLYAHAKVFLVRLTCRKLSLQKRSMENGNLPSAISAQRWTRAPQQTTT